jgi:hypothetical protein
MPDTEGIKTAVQAFFNNDPYYLRPNGQTNYEKRLWFSLSKAYLKG